MADSNVCCDPLDPNNTKSWEHLFPIMVVGVHLTFSEHLDKGILVNGEGRELFELRGSLVGDA